MSFYDWATSAVWTTVIAAIFSIYVYRVSAADLPELVVIARFALATTFGLVTVAILAPALGVIADYAGV